MPLDATSRRLAALVVFGTAAFFSPLLGAFNRAGRLWGLPLFPCYVFAVWALLIVAAWWFSRRSSR